MGCNWEPEHLSDSHNSAEGTPSGYGGPSKSSSKRLLLITIIMVGFAALTWGPSLFTRNVQAAFIPAWLTLTIATVIISMWFTKRLLEAEQFRDHETAPQPTPAQSH